MSGNGRIICYCIIEKVKSIYNKFILKIIRILVKLSACNENGEMTYSHPFYKYGTLALL